MVLQDSERALIQTFCDKIAPKADALGVEIMERYANAYPQITDYFKKPDSSINKPVMIGHGGKLLISFGDAIKNYDNLKCSLGSLTDLHLNTHNVSREPYKLLNHSILITFAVNFSPEFKNYQMENAWRKFLDEIACVMTSKN
ncbi:Hemoglobin subunit zeta [Pelobates cultripes]|uniref:Hemoglobin subunit zeta n=1 Tax=Pelobates cultripes TaxID=61616 RepID=A0AAD1RHX2_PELCU|nr:Hemoglobin subunit zeta [Pelobates cultripes]